MREGEKQLSDDSVHTRLVSDLTKKYKPEINDSSFSSWYAKRYSLQYVDYLAQKQTSSTNSFILTQNTQGKDTGKGAHTMPAKPPGQALQLKLTQTHSASENKERLQI